MPAARFIYVADVYCPWCYAFAPIMERLTKEFPEFPITIIGGNLVSQPMTLAQDVANQPDLIDFWHEVERISGRSLQGAIQAAQSDREITLFSPGADEVFVVLKKLAPGHELAQFMELEDLFYGQGIDLFNVDTLNKLAERWKIRPADFEKALDKPAAISATENSLAKARALMGEITSYPSVLLERNGKIDAVSRGYVHYETVIARLKDAMADLGITIDGSGQCSRQHGCTTGRHR